VKIICRRTQDGLVPVSMAQAELLMKIPAGQDVTVDVIRTRNIGHHRKFFELLRQSFDMQETFTTMKQWRAIVTVAAGYCDIVADSGGKAIAVPQSISFANMDQTAFDQFYKDVIDIICERYVNATPDELMKIMEFL